MPSTPSAWRLLHPKWLLLHVAVIAACVTMVWLGHWQWGAAHRHHGEIRNYAYAFQWWAFTGFALLMWFRVVKDYLRPRSDSEDVPAPAVAEADSAPRYVGYTPPAPPADDDPERARFNAYLAQLDAKDRAKSSATGGPADRPTAEATEREESR